MARHGSQRGWHFDRPSHKCKDVVLTSAELKRWLEKQGRTFGTQMYPKKELKTGTVAAIKKQLGLK